MAKLVIENVSKVYEIDEGGGRVSHVEALRNINLAVPEGQFVSIIGPSGCGKSTLLMIVAGLLEASSGRVLVDGRPVKGPGLDRGVVFQDFALFPWMTTERNIKFGMQMRGWPKERQDQVARELIAEVGLQGFEHHYPHRLSGGMKQRVAVARALAYDPEVLLMDEPFGALDAQTRARLQLMVSRIWEKRRKTIFFVTHNVEEAVYLSDRVIVFSARPGQIANDIPIDLPRPRVRLDDRFVKVQKEVARALALVYHTSGEEDPELMQLVGG